MKQVSITTNYWVATDGTQFTDKENCIEYEKTNALYNFIDQNIRRTYSDDAGFSIIEVTDVEELVIKFLPELNAILERMKELS